jgi:hypothetical protein
MISKWIRYWSLLFSRILVAARYSVQLGGEGSRTRKRHIVNSHSHTSLWGSLISPSLHNVVKPDTGIEPNKDSWQPLLGARMVRLQTQFRDDVVMVPVEAISLAVDIQRKGEQATEPCDASHNTSHLHGAVYKVPVDYIVCQPR